MSSRNTSWEKLDCGYWWKAVYTERCTYGLEESFWKPVIEILIRRRELILHIVEQTFYGWLKRYRSKVAEDVKDLAAGPGGFASIEVVPTLVHDRPQLFAEIGNIRLYKEVPAEYLKALLS